MIDWSHLKKAATGLQSCPEEYAMCGATVRQLSGDILALLDELAACKRIIDDVHLIAPGQPGYGDLSREQRTWADVSRFVATDSKDA